MVAGLERLGWRADEPAVQEAVPVVLRGGNVVAVLPPVPAWADPILAALLGRQANAAAPVLLLAAPAQVAEWAVALGALTEPAPRRIDVAREIRSSTATAGDRPPDVLIASPAGALNRHVHSALHPERFAAVVFAWPEEWQADDAVAALLQDVPRDAQRIVLSAHPERLGAADGIIERYARRALVLTTGAEGAMVPPPREASVRTVATSWAARALTVALVVEALDRPAVTIWTADARDHQQIRRALGSLREGVAIATRVVPGAGSIVCYDLPSPHQLAQLAAVGEVVLLVPPGCERYVRSLTPVRRPMTLDSPAAAAFDRDAGLRREIAAAIERGDDAAALYALGPLFEQSDPQLVAAALFGLWRRAISSSAGAEPSGTTRPGHTSGAGIAPGRPADAPSAAAAAPGTARLWIGAGRKDDATVGDFVAVLIKEAGLDRARIGRIELRDTFALVEVPAEEAESLARRLTGLTIRKRKLSARVDRGRGRGA